MAGARVASRAVFRGPVRRSYDDAMVVRQLAAACARSAALNSTCTSFSASAMVAGETSGPTAGAVPKAGGAPGGASGGFWASGVAAAPSTRSAALLINRLRESVMSAPILNCIGLSALRKRKRPVMQAEGLLYNESVAR